MVLNIEMLLCFLLGVFMGCMLCLTISFLIDSKNDKLNERIFLEKTYLELENARLKQSLKECESKLNGSDING